MRNIAFDINKSYLASNPMVMNKIVNKLVDDRSEKELKRATMLRRVCTVSLAIMRKERRF